MKIKLMFDSSCTKSKKELEKIGDLFVSLGLSLDGKSYESGIDIDVETIFKKMNKNTIARTSQANPSKIEEQFRKGIKDGSFVLYIPISTEVSETYSGALNISQKDEFKDKVFVYPSKFMSHEFQLYWDKIHSLKKAGNLKNIISWLDEYNLRGSYGLVVPHNIIHLHKSGRISKLQYMIGNLLNVTPVITYSGGKMKDTKTYRVKGDFRKAIEKAAALIAIYYLENKNKDGDYNLKITSAGDIINSKEEIKFFMDLVEKNGVSKEDIILKPLIIDSSVAAHVGPKTLGFFANYIKK